MNGSGYYAKNLSGQRLQRCYEIASPRVRRYLEAEIRHIRSRVRPSDEVLELGCGYGRITFRLARVASRTVGIDHANGSLELARQLSKAEPPCEFMLMEALDLRFEDGTFDVVVCAQNGICAFGVDPESLVREALRVTRPNGIVLLSTYSDRFWPDRLAWFESQAAEGLLGPIDHASSGDGVIVCEDGFRAGRLTPEELADLCSRLGLEPEITEIDGACVICEIRKTGRGGRRK